MKDPVGLLRHLHIHFLSLPPFASQEAFAAACRDVAQGLERLEGLLNDRRFLCGDRFTMADLMLLPCAARFDAVYQSLFLRRRNGSTWVEINGKSMENRWKFNGNR